MDETKTESRSGGEPAAGGHSRRKRRIAAAAGTALALALVAAAFGVSTLVPKGAEDGWYDPCAVNGSYAGKSDELMSKELNEQVEKGSMNISVASVIRVDEGGSEGVARLENIAANRVDQKVSIFLGESEDPVYESGAFAPGQTIEQITLSRTLDPGVHEATVVFTGYDRETRAEAGRLAANVVIAVG